MHESGDLLVVSIKLLVPEHDLARPDQVPDGPRRPELRMQRPS